MGAAHFSRLSNGFLRNLKLTQKSGLRGNMSQSGLKVFYRHFLKRKRFKVDKLRRLILEFLMVRFSSDDR